MNLIKSLSLSNIKYVDEKGIEKVEYWESINGCDSYELSSIGRIKSLKRTFIRSNGYPMSVKEKIRKPNYNQGYAILNLKFDNGVLKPIKIHRLVAITFIPNPLNLPEVNHKNFIRHDNRIDNLEWSTHADNVKYSFEANNYNTSGVLNGRSKLNESQVLEIRARFSQGKEFNARLIGIEYGISRAVVSKIVNRQSWKHI